MEGYLGEFDTDAYSQYTPLDWITYWIGRYASIGGDHHKAWVFDQVMQIRFGTPVIVKEARWKNGLKEIRTRLGTPSDSYVAWVGDDAQYDKGIAP